MKDNYCREEIKRLEKVIDGILERDARDSVLFLKLAKVVQEMIYDQQKAAK